MKEKSKDTSGSSFWTFFFKKKTEFHSAEQIPRAAAVLGVAGCPSHPALHQAGHLGAAAAAGVISSQNSPRLCSHYSVFSLACLSRLTHFPGAVRAPVSPGKVRSACSSEATATVLELGGLTHCPRLPRCPPGRCRTPWALGHSPPSPRWQ